MCPLAKILRILRQANSSPRMYSLRPSKGRLHHISPRHRVRRRQKRLQPNTKRRTNHDTLQPNQNPSMPLRRSTQRLLPTGQRPRRRPRNIKEQRNRLQQRQNKNLNHIPIIPPPTLSIHPTNQLRHTNTSNDTNRQAAKWLIRPKAMQRTSRTTVKPRTRQYKHRQRG